jgi:hypothetical protein
MASVEETQHETNARLDSLFRQNGKIVRVGSGTKLDAAPRNVSNGSI